MTFARDGSGSRPLAVAVAGWALIADAATSMVFVGIGAFVTDIPIQFRIGGFVIFSAIAVLEGWSGLGVLQRRRWFLGVAFPAIFLVLGFLVPPLDDAPPEPLFLVYRIVATVLWAFVVGALIWHQPWFAGTDGPIEDRLRRAR